VKNHWEVTNGLIHGSADWNTIYVYWSSPGNGSVKLTQTNEMGCTGSISKEITISSTEQNFNVSGTVIDRSTSNPIANAKVEFSAATHDTSVVTNASGAFSLTLSNRFVYVAKASVPADSSYIPQYYDSKESIMDATSIDLLADRTDINFMLEKTPSNGNRVFGNVLSTQGDSIPSQIVIFVVFPADTTVQSVFQARTFDATNTNGKYSFSNLEPGKYILFGMPADYDYAPGYFNENGIPLLLWKSATQLDVQPNSTIGPKNIILERITPTNGFGIVAGRISRLDGIMFIGKDDIPFAKEGVAGAIVVSKDDKNNVRKYNISNMKGNFKIDSLANGKYKLIIDKIGLSHAEIDFEISDTSSLIEENVTVNKEIPTSVNESNTTKENFILIYPNPASKDFKIDFDSYAENVEVEMHNIVGVSVYKGSFPTQTGRESLGFRDIKLSAGVYFIKLKSGKIQYNVKVIIY
jgi:hypothetical protein